jgi:hypothetical protein
MRANQPARAIGDRGVPVGARGVISGAALPHLGWACSSVQHPNAKDSRVLKTTALIMVLTGSLVAPCVWGQDDFGDDESLQADDQSNDEALESEGDTDTDESADYMDVDNSAADETSTDESDDMADAEDSDDQSDDETEEFEGNADTDESADETDVDDSKADEAPPPPPPPPPPPATERVATPAPAAVPVAPAPASHWTFELAVYLEDAPWPAAKEVLIEFAQRSGAPLKVAENLRNLPDDGVQYENIEEIWPDYRTQTFEREQIPERRP